MIPVQSRTEVETMDRALPRPLDWPWRRLASAVCLALIVAWWAWLQGYDAFPHWIDAPAFWRIRLDHTLYAAPVGSEGAFLYSPLAAQVLAPFGLLPFPVFYALLSAINLTALVWMTGPILGLGLLLFYPPIASEVGTGNVNLLLGAAIVASFRHPGWWAVPILTKVTPGVGLLWYAFRREWRAFGVGLAVTVGLVAVSALIAPDLWVAWGERLMAGGVTDPRGAFSEIPLWARLMVAVGLVWLAARIDRPALVVCASVVALPVIWLNALAMLVAVIPLWRRVRPAAIRVGAGLRQRPIPDRHPRLTTGRPGDVEEQPDHEHLSRSRRVLHD